MVQWNPCLGYVGSKLPSSSWVMLRSMRRDPKPRRMGGFTSGPPRSRQSIRRRPMPWSAVTFQLIEMRPVGRKRTVFGSIRRKLVKHEAQADRLPRAQIDRWTGRYHASILAAHIGFEFDRDQIMERRPFPCSARE